MKSVAAAIVAIAVLISPQPLAGDDAAAPDSKTTTKPVWIAGAAANDAARDEAFGKLTNSEKRNVLSIRQKLKAGGFTSLTQHEIQFAYKDEGYKCLFWELAPAILANPDALTDKGRKLLGWDHVTTVAFACEPKMIERLSILRLGETLVNRDRQINDREITMARDSRYLSSVFDQYVKLGLDASKVAERKRREAEAVAEEAKAAAAERREKIDKLNLLLSERTSEREEMEKQIAKDTKAAKNLELRLARINQSKNPSEAMRDKLNIELNALQSKIDKEQRTVDDQKEFIRELEGEIAAANGR